MAKFRKVENSRQKNFTPVKLFLDDIEKITEVFESNSRPYSIVINADYEFETLTDLLESNKFKKVKSFHIKSNTPYISVRLTEKAASIYIDTDDTNSLGMFHRLDDILIKCRKRPVILYSANFGWVVMSITLPVDGLVFFANIKRSPAFLIVSALLLLTIFFFWNNIGTRLRTYSAIYLTKRESHPGFFKRNKDQIFLLIIGAVIGSLFTLIVQYIVATYFRQKGSG
jgi:hypothetical protein